jgi:hypothetical protein
MRSTFRIAPGFGCAVLVVLAGWIAICTSIDNSQQRYANSQQRYAISEYQKAVVLSVDQCKLISCLPKKGIALAIFALVIRKGG